MRTTPVLLAVLTAVAITMTACSDDPAGPGPTPTPTPIDNTPNTVKFDVIWSPESVVFKSEDMAELKRIDSAAFRFYFNPEGQKAQTLRKGSILVLNDYAIRKVTTVQTSGGSLVVNTEAAELTEAMVDADINWNYGVDVSAEALAKGLGKISGARTVRSKDSLIVSFATGAYEIEFVIKQKPGETVIDGKLQKEAFSGSGVKSGRFTMSGTMKKFRNVGSIKIKNRQLQEFSVDNNNFEADFLFTAVAAGSGNDIGVEIPVPIFTYPIPQLPFFTFDLKALLVLNASVPSDGSCDLGIRLQYVSNQGFQYEPQTKNIKPRSTVDWKGFTIPKPPQTASSSPIGISFGIGFPRLEMNIIGTKTGAFVQTAGLVGGDFTMFPVCRQAKASAIVACGLTLGIDGLNTGIKKTIWQKDTTFLKSGQCPP